MISRLNNRDDLGYLGRYRRVSNLYLYDPDLVLLLPMTGADESQVFLDIARGGNAPHTVTAVGDAKITTAVADPFGVSGGVAYLANMASDIVNVTNNTDFVFDADFTIGFWARVDSGGDRSFWVNGKTGSNEYFALNYDYANTQFNLYLDQNTTKTTVTGIDLSGAWNHVELCRSGETVKLFVGGDEKLSTTKSGTKGFSDANVNRIGGGDSSTPGYVSDFAIYRRALHTANFTPPPRLTPHL